MMAPVHTLADFPELAEARARWTAIRDEALAALAAAPARGPAVLPIGPVAEAATRRIPTLVGAVLSILPPGARSAVPPQPSRLVTALLCLVGGGASHLVVDGERRDLVDGELLIFDHRLARESSNDGARDRVVLVLLLDPVRRGAGAAVVARAVEAIFGAGRLQVASELFAPGPAAEVKALATRLRTGFPDLAVTIDQLVADGDRVACGWTGVGSQRGPFWNVPATGARVRFGCTSFYALRGGTIVSDTTLVDMFAILTQLRAALRA
jgi:predicted ester cyclase